MKKSLCFLALCLLCFTGWLFAQTGENERSEALSSLNTDGDLPRTFRNISLGMDIDDLKTALIRDSYFNYRGDRDVSLLPFRDETLIDIVGYSFIRRAYFQLRDKAVFIMAFSLNPSLIDHYSVYTTFTKKYGEPEILDPRQAVWFSQTTRVSIERPLTVKYIDLGVFNELVNESKTRENYEIEERRLFLDDF